MEPTPGAKPASRKLHALVERVAHNPLQLRVILMLLIFGLWYASFSMPISAGIDETTRKILRERKRLELATEIERLRIQVDRFQGRLPQKTDPNEWVQYMLAGIRGFPLRMVMLDTDSTKDVGPYKAIVVKMQVEGTFHDIDAFLRWVETNERLLRVDVLKLEPVRTTKGKMSANLVILGVMG